MVQRVLTIQPQITQLLLVDYLFRWGIMEQFLPRLMEPHGLLGLPDRQILSATLITQMDF